MKGLYKTNMRKLMKSKFYILGLIIAMVATFAFTKNMMNFTGIFESMGDTGRMHFISAAIVAFFTIYTPLFVCEEYSEGSIKNKIISGFTQKQIFIAGLLAQLSAVLIMWVIFFISGLAGGGRMTGYWMGSLLITLLAILGYTTLIYAIAFRLEKPIRSTIVAFVLLNLNFNMITFGNLLIMISKGVVLKIAAIVYNISVLGQWFVLTGLAEDTANPGPLCQILTAVIVLVVSIAYGTIKLNKRDLK